ncbi:hypothetical protein E4U09_005576 [Claviceps aff. purpurea]|uniref:Uncharacterized protein n=1 Tax=Claviceps aff. purpurea TaxID=1967640 RepID=A0A9P7QEA4_9HYPO|nr:hypothetical protein E4U09_005576 [Claviceps aff. purpurea]
MCLDCVNKTGEQSAENYQDPEVLIMLRTRSSAREETTATVEQAGELTRQKKQRDESDAADEVR